MDFINDLFNRRVSKILYGKEPATTTGTHPGIAREAIDDALRAVAKLNNPLPPKTSYCSWKCFVDLLMSSDKLVITNGYKTSDITWRFELNGTVEFVVSEAVPIDDKILQFKEESYLRNL